MPEKTGYAASSTAAAATDSAPGSKTAAREMSRRLAADITYAHTKTEGMRQRRKELVKIYAGDHYFNKDKTEDEFPVNILHHHMATLAWTLTTAPPTVVVKAKTAAGLTGYAMLRQRRLDFLVRELRMHELTRNIFLDAMTMYGVAKTGIGPTGVPLDEWLDPGRPGLWRISPDDHLLDPHCRSRRERAWEAHRYRASRADLYMLGMKDDEIDTIPKWCVRGSQVRAEAISGEDDVGADSEFVEWYDLIDVYIPPNVMGREPKIMTLPGDPEVIGHRMKNDGAAGPIRDPIEYTGPEGGPYHILGFNEVPDNPFPTPPAGFWIALARMVNHLAVHNIKAESVAKNLIVIDDNVTAAEENALKEAPPNGIVRIRNISSVQPVSLGGASERSLSVMNMLMGLFNQQTGNAQMLAGVGSQGDKTATEVGELSRRLSANVDAMESRMYEFDDAILRDLSFYDKADPTLDIGMRLRAGGIDIPMRLTAEMERDNDLEDYHIEIRRGSMRRLPGEVKAKKMIELTATALPIAMQAKQAFPNLDVTAFMVMLSEGVFDPEELDVILGDPALAAINQEVAQVGPSTGQRSNEKPRGGLPGTAGQRNGAFTGANSPNFDMNAISQRTVAGMGYSQ